MPPSRIPRDDLVDAVQDLARVADLFLHIFGLNFLTLADCHRLIDDIHGGPNLRSKAFPQLFLSGTL